MLREMPGLLVPALRKGMIQAMILAVRTARSPYLRGKALQKRTGRLINSIQPQVEIRGDQVVGSIGTNVVYGRVHELGFRGPVRIGEHARTIRQAFGRAIAPRQVTVRAHTRQVDFPARPFLRPAIEDSLGRIERILAKAIEEALG